MKTEFLNDGQPFPVGHHKAGQIGILIDFEDGVSQPQRVYAPDRDALLQKALTMYGNSHVRINELKRDVKPAATPATPAAPAPAAAPARMTDSEKMQASADITDPAKAGQAIVSLLKDATGVDLAQQARNDAKAAEVTRLQGEVDKFMRENPDYPATPRNAELLRNHAFSHANGKVTAADFTRAFEALQQLGVLESAPTQEQPPAAGTGEPLAPPPPRSSGSTGARPSTLGAAPRQVPGGAVMTRKQVLDMAGTDEYERRLKEEPGFRERVNAVLAKG
jgi:hypothetical protein